MIDEILNATQERQSQETSDNSAALAALVSEVGKLREQLEQLQAENRRLREGGAAEPKASKKTKASKASKKAEKPKRKPYVFKRLRGGGWGVSAEKTATQPEQGDWLRVEKRSGAVVFVKVGRLLGSEESREAYGTLALIAETSDERPQDAKVLES